MVPTASSTSQSCLPQPAKSSLTSPSTVQNGISTVYRRIDIFSGLIGAAIPISPYPYWMQSDFCQNQMTQVMYLPPTYNQSPSFETLQTTNNPSI